MKHCPNRECPEYVELGKASEYEDSASTCHSCGGGLVDGSGPEDKDVVLERNLERICTTSNFYEAEVIKGALEAAGIRVWLKNEDVFGVWPLNPSLEWLNLELFVRPRVAERARKILENARQPVHHRPWHCPECGAKVSGDLVECWKCTRPRPRKARPVEAVAAAEAPAKEPGGST